MGKVTSIGQISLMKRNPPIKLSQSNSPAFQKSDLYSKYSFGSIQCVKLRNFMTFEKITISPGPGLNMIIGPNGSGKSSIVIAIGLCFNIKPANVEKASKVSGFIRHSCEFAKIKVLITSNPPVWISRTISIDNTSQWRTKTSNGRWTAVRESEINGKIHSLHIKIDNLCMFLPQERVKRFTTMNQRELLFATEEAINGDLFEDHKLIIKDFSNLKNKKSMIVDLQGKEQQLNTEMQRMNSEMQRFRQYEDCKKNIERIEKAIPWAQYRVEKELYEQIQKELKEELSTFSRYAKTIDPLVEKIRNVETNFDKNQAQLRQASAEFTAHQKEILKLNEQRFQLQTKIRSYNSKHIETKIQIETLQKDHDKLQAALTHVTEALKEISDDSALKIEREDKQKAVFQAERHQAELNSEKRQFEEKLNSKTAKLSQIEKKIEEYNNQKNQFMNHLRNRLRKDDVYQVYQFIENNRSSFVGKVYGPICAELQFSNQTNANIIHMLVENHYLFGFLVEHTSDFERLESFLKEKRLERVSVVKLSNTNAQSSQNQGSPDLSKYGFNYYAQSLYNAPKAIKDFLKNIASLDKIPVSKELPPNISLSLLNDRVFPENGISRYIIGDRMYIIKNSHYSSSSTIISIQIRESSIWSKVSSQTDDMKMFSIKRDKIKEKIRIIEEQAMNAKKSFTRSAEMIAKMRSDIQSITEELKKKSKTEETIKQIKSKIKQNQKEMESLPSSAAQLKAKHAEAIEKLAQSWDIQTKLLKKAFNVLQKHDTIRRNEYEISEELRGLKDQLVMEKQQFKAQEAAIKALNEKKGALKNKIKRLKKEASDKCPLNQENTDLLQSLPSELDLLLDSLGRYKAQSEQLTSRIDSTIIEKHADKEKRLLEIKQDLQLAVEQEEQASKELQKRFSDWKSKMESEVRKMSESFRNLMESCNYRGEVRLDFDDVSKIETYKLSLMVAFNRESQMSLLSSTRQSGGEKSVTTIMFLLALQDCTEFPFRVVDEINQGMDEKNDRNTLQQVMQYALRKNSTSQYFLVTPKLLTKIENMKGVTVMVVMNGPYVEPNLTKPITINE